VAPAEVVDVTPLTTCNRQALQAASSKLAAQMLRSRLQFLLNLDRAAVVVDKAARAGQTALDRRVEHVVSGAEVAANPVAERRLPLCGSSCLINQCSR
jgi:hypothetical protein